MNRLILLPLSCLFGVAVATAPAIAHAAPGTATVESAASAPAPSQDAVRREIAALLAQLRVSPCYFQRNGRWYGGERAADHLQRKLDYAIGRGRTVDSTEAFIDEAATHSSFTGRAYRVRCGDAEPVPAADWFRARLRELRTPG
jgi:hypothetical protein